MDITYCHNDLKDGHLTGFLIHLGGVFFNLLLYFAVGKNHSKWAVIAAEHLACWLIITWTLFIGETAEQRIYYL